jgi:putative IMPACT (imprinted ancient) family translation regulator
MTAEEQRSSVKRSEYAYVTIMIKYKKKDRYNYMSRFNDASVLNSDGSINIRISGEPREFINLVQNQSFTLMWTNTHI